MIRESILEKYRSAELDRSVRRALTGIPIALVVNGALVGGLLTLGRGIEFTSPDEIPIDFVVTEVVEESPESIVAVNPIVQPLDNSQANAPSETNPIVQPLNNSQANPPSEANPIAQPLNNSQANAPSEANPIVQPLDNSQANPPSEMNPIVQPLDNSQADAPSETNPIAQPLDNSQANAPSEANPIGQPLNNPPMNSGETTSNTTEFAARLGQMVGQPSPGKAALPAPPQPTSRFGCVQCDKPRFPRGAKERGIQGEARVSLDVDASGNVVGVRLISSSGHPELDQAAIEQARRWRFTPSEAGRQGVSARVDFQIEGTDYQRQAQERRMQREQASPTPVQEKPLTVAPPPIADPPPAAIAEPPPPPPIAEPPPPPPIVESPPPIEGR